MLGSVHSIMFTSEFRLEVTMAKIRYVGEPKKHGGADEHRFIKKIENDTPESWIAISNWFCPRPGRDAVEIDATLICPNGIFILEAKNWAGSIRGDMRDWEWLSSDGFTKRQPSPITKIVDCTFDLIRYLNRSLTQKREFFDRGGSRLKIWVGPYVVLLNKSADFSEIKDTRVDRTVIRIGDLKEEFFVNIKRPNWATNLSEDQVDLVADAIYHQMAAPIVGVDFGTTNSAVAYYNNQSQIELFNVSEERVLTPSLFAFESGRELVGLGVETALEELDNCRRMGLPPSINPRNVVFWIKKLLGKTYQEYASSKDEFKEFPYIVKNQHNAIVVSLDGKPFLPEHIAAAILRSLYDIARSRLGDDVQAVIPVPVRFTDRQRRALELAAKRAGFKEVHLAIDEATAAALFLAATKDYNGTLAVYDLGGGTFDISIVEVRNGVTNVKAIRGDGKLGGYHFDLRLGDYLLNKGGEYRGLAALSVDDQYTYRRELERARKLLSTGEHTKLFFRNPATGRPEAPVLTREELERATESLVGRTLDLCEEAVRAAKNNGIERIDDVIMSGGLTFMPLVQQRVRDFFFPNEQNKQLVVLDNPSVLVARGAGIYAGMLMGHIQDTHVGERVAPSSYGVNSYLGYATDKNIYMSVLIGRDQKVFDRDGQPQVFPTRNYTTIPDNQSRLGFKVLQASSPASERRLADQCITIGTFSVDIEPLPAGQNGVEIGFAIDRNGILEVTYAELKHPLENCGKKRFNMFLRATGESVATQ
jgi:molecular chaperone DnaK